MSDYEQTVMGKRARREQGLYEVGDILQDRFEILGTLGKGGMGVVYRCMDKVAGIEVAIKTLSPELSASGWEMDEIKENFQLVYKLHHPYIANYNSLERDRVTGNYFLVMEYVAGEELRYYLRRQKQEGRFSEDLVIRLVRQIADALDYAHANKIIHRDIKPANIFVDRNGDIKLLDFGLAAQIHSSLSRVTMVKTDDTSGTIPYMSPEQWLCMPQEAPSDQYALAATLYEIFAGTPPFDSPDKDNVRHCVLNVVPAPLQNVSPAIAKAVAKALSKKPEDRYPSCKAFADALVHKTIETVKTKKSNPAWICLTLGVLLLAGVAVYNFLSNESAPAPQPASVTYTTEAERKYRKAAEQGDVDAQKGLADCYYYGRLGVCKNYAEAVKWYRKAAEQGNAYAQYSLGYCYKNGDGVSKDLSEAVRLYRKSAEQGYAAAQNGLAICYENGDGVSKDLSEAVNWYRKAAEQGNASAQCNLGYCYDKGIGVVQDYSEAVKWYRKAADQGNAYAQCNLGYCYEFGKGVSKDVAEAVRWYRKAAARGNEGAMKRLKELGED